MKKFIKKATKILLLIFILLSILPYLIPSNYLMTAPPVQPFEESQFVLIDDVMIHYRVWKPITELKGKILLVHGFGASTFSWRNNIDSLFEEGYLVVAVDLPGFGYSDRSANAVYDQSERSKLLWRLIERIDKGLYPAEASMNWHLMGHSLGGGTVMTMAADMPEKTASLMVVAGAIFNKPREGRFIFRYPPATQWMKIILRHFIINWNNIERFLASAYGTPPKEYEVEGYLAPLKIKGTGNHLINLFTASQKIPIEEVRSGKFPILAIWGELDHWVPSSQGSLLKEKIGRTEYKEIKGAGHCPMETHSDVFNEIIQEFLQKNIRKER